MKKIVIFSFAALLAACSNDNEQVKVGEENIVAEATDGSVEYIIDTENSVIEWFGSKLLGKTHHGYINLTSGSLSIENDIIEAGNFKADMHSITNVDLPEDGEYNQAMLVGHLKSPDFFDAENHPESTFQITSIQVADGEDGNTHEVSGNFTIRGITKEITFPAQIAVNGDEVSLLADFHFNRLDWEVNFDKDGVEGFLEGVLKQGKDDFVKNEIGLKLNLIGKKA